MPGLRREGVAGIRSSFSRAEISFRILLYTLPTSRMSVVLIQTLGRGLWETQEGTRGADLAIIPASSLRGPRHLLLSPGRGHWAHWNKGHSALQPQSLSQEETLRWEQRRHSLPSHGPAHPAGKPSATAGRAAEVPCQNQQAGQLGLSGSSSALWGPRLAIWDSGHLPAEEDWAPPGNSTCGVFGARLDSGWGSRAGPLCRPMSHASERSRGPESRTPRPGALTHTPSDPSRHLLCPFLIMGF